MPGPRCSVIYFGGGGVLPPPRNGRMNAATTITPAASPPSCLDADRFENRGRGPVRPAKPPPPLPPPQTSRTLCPFPSRCFFLGLLLARVRASRRIPLEVSSFTGTSVKRAGSSSTTTTTTTTTTVDLLFLLLSFFFSRCRR